MSARSELRGVSVTTYDCERRLLKLCRGVDSFWLYPSAAEQHLTSGKIDTWTDHLTAQISGHTAHDHVQGVSGNRPIPAAIGRGTGAAFNTTHLLIGGGTFATASSHTLSIVWTRASSNGGAWDGLACCDPDLLVGLSAILNDTYSIVHDSAWQYSSTLAGTGLHAVTYVFSGTIFTVRKESASSSSTTGGTTVPVTASYVGNSPASNSGVVGTIASVIYVGAALPELHPQHRQWAQRYLGAP
jgi:hypothetical protein